MGPEKTSYDFIVQHQTSRRRIKLNLSISTFHFVHICKLAQLVPEKKTRFNLANKRADRD